MIAWLFSEETETPTENKNFSLEEPKPGKSYRSLGYKGVTLSLVNHLSVTQTMFCHVFTSIKYVHSHLYIM